MLYPIELLLVRSGLACQLRRPAAPHVPTTVQILILLRMAECANNNKKALPLYKWQCKGEKLEYPARPSNTLDNW